MNKIKDYLHVKVGLKKPKTKLCSLDNSAYLTPLGTFSFKTFYFRDEIRMIHARTYTVTYRNCQTTKLCNNQYTDQCITNIYLSFLHYLFKNLNSSIKSFSFDDCDVIFLELMNKLKLFTEPLL